VTENRGVLYPAALPTFERRQPAPELDRLVRWFWISRWNIAPGRSSRQHVLAFPALNLVVLPETVELAGATTVAGYRDLRGTGWAVGALLRPAATVGLTDDPSALVDRVTVIDLPDLRAAVATAMDRPQPDLAAACRAFEDWLSTRIPTVTADAALINTLVARIEQDPTLGTVELAAAAVGVSARTAQRLTRRHLGLTPLQLIHRRRLQHAAELLRTDPERPVATIAAELGYADQAHLIREFRRVLKFTPGGYRSSAGGDR
jgi:AraC-like DNA-binding protein